MIIAHFSSLLRQGGLAVEAQTRHEELTCDSLATCEEAVVDVKGGRAPFTLSLVNEQGHQLAHWSNQYAQGRYSLPVKAHAGERIAWRIVDSQGTEACVLAHP